jgi:hypothetical protein
MDNSLKVDISLKIIFKDFNGRLKGPLSSNGNGLFGIGRKFHGRREV